MSETEGQQSVARSRKALKAFRGWVVAIYWIALPLTAILAVSAVISAALTPDSVRAWLWAAAAIAFAVVIAWRLWLNRRALGLSGPLPRPRRLLTVFLPVGVLAAGGMCILGWGLIWLVIAAWLLFSPEGATEGFQQLVMGPGVALGGGVAMALIGAALMFPLVRLLRTRPAAPAET